MIGGRQDFSVNAPMTGFHHLGGLVIGVRVLVLAFPFAAAAEAPVLLGAIAKLRRKKRARAQQGREAGAR